MIKYIFMTIQCLMTDVYYNFSVHTLVLIIFADMAPKKGCKPDVDWPKVKQELVYSNWKIRY